MHERAATVVESGNGPYGQYVTAGRHVFGADEPESLGGRDTGPDPYELLLAALGACTSMTLRLYAERHKWPLTRVEVHLKHLRQGTPSGEVPDQFERVIKLSGDLTDEQRRRLLEIAERCPVSRTLTRASEIANALG
jgi:putative redox protein